jgi:hypothetical protein
VSILKKIFLWTYERNTWQWDMLCALILVFIFLTPKSWFDHSEREVGLGHQSPVVATVFVGAEVVDNASDNSKLRDRVRTLTGRQDAEVGRVQPVKDKEGRTLGYQVDIR